MSICSTMVFPPLRNCDHVVVSVSIDFPSNSQRDALFHCTTYDYSFILLVIVMVFVIISEMFSGRISLRTQSLMLYLMLTFLDTLNLVQSMGECLNE